MHNATSVGVSQRVCRLFQHADATLEEKTALRGQIALPQPVEQLLEGVARRGAHREIRAVVGVAADFVDFRNGAMGKPCHQSRFAHQATLFLGALHHVVAQHFVGHAAPQRAIKAQEYLSLASPSQRCKIAVVAGPKGTGDASGALSDAESNA